MAAKLNPAKAVTSASVSSVIVASQDSATTNDAGDAFRWLEDGSAPNVKQWVTKHDALARETLGQMPGRDALKRRLTELVYIEQRGAPRRLGQRYFYSIKSSHQEKAVYYARDGRKGPERVLLDPNVASAAGPLSLSGQSPSPRGRYLAYLEHQNNADAATLRVLDATTGAALPDTIPDLLYTGISWAHDETGFYYTWVPAGTLSLDDRIAGSELRFHRLGSEVATDTTVFPASGDPTRHLSGYVSYDGEALFVTLSRGWSENDVFFAQRKHGTQKDAPFSSNSFVPLAKDLKATYSAFKYRNWLYVLTNEGAPRYRLFRVAPEHLSRADWQELIVEDKEAVLDDARIVGGLLCLTYLRNVVSDVQIRQLDGKLLRTLAQPGLGTTSALMGEEDSDEAYYSYSSFAYPTAIFETSVHSGGEKLFARLKVPADFEAVTTAQEWFTSKDGTRVPMFVIHNKTLQRNGANPTLLTAYGGFAVSLLPAFNAALFAWLEAGGVVAIPNLRGGGEFGEAWHQSGMLEHKQNVFDDVAAAAQHLVAAQYTSAAQLGIVGRSNGGLLVGAALTQHPELFGAAVCGVPLLDMLRYHLFGLGKTWVPEYGNPDNPTQHAWLAKYSPYHQLRRGVHYPPLLMASADTDDRVDPMHARKFVAAMEAVLSDGALKPLLRVERNAGHTGADLRSAYVEQTADEYSFLLHYLR